MTHPLKMIHSYAKYGKTMLKQKKSYEPDMNLHRQTDRQKERFLYTDTPLNFVHRLYKKNLTDILLTIEDSYISNDLQAISII